MRRQPDYVRACAIGVAAGLAAAFAMELWQTGASALMKAADDAKGGGDKGGGDDEAATEKAADRVSEVVRGRPVSADGRTAAGRQVHYVTGAALGAAYAVTAEGWPEVTAGFGGLFGLATSLVIDEGVVPALGLGAAPADAPPISHAYSLVAHAVFGVALEGARRLLTPRG